MVSLQSVTTALYKAAFIAGATAGGGPAGGATAASFVNSPTGEAAIAKAVTITLGENNVDSGNFAMGGLVMSPTLAMIGEAGSEMVIPLNVNRSEEEYMRLRDLAQATKNQTLENQLAKESGTRPRKFTKAKRSRSARVADKKLSKAFKMANEKLRKKNGQLKKGKTQADVARMAQRLRKKM